ncbi:MAG: PCC domain-containing protein [Bradymonadaceae bacterium]
MIFRLSRQTYRLVGRLDEGDDLVESLTRICKESKISAGEIRAVGSFDDIELVRFDGDTKEYRTILGGEGDYDLITLDGNISTLGQEVVLRLEGLISAMGPVGPQVVAGQIRSARAVTCEFVIDVFADLKMERRFDAKSGRLLIDDIDITASHEEPAHTPPVHNPTASQTSAAPARAPETPPSAPAPQTHQAPRPGSQMSWGEAIQKTDEPRKMPEKPSSRQARTPTTPEHYAETKVDEPAMSPGDILDHPKLGRCRVIKVEEDEYAHIRLPRGKIRKLALEICEIDYKGEEEGRKIFQCRIRK